MPRQTWVYLPGKRFGRWTVIESIDSKYVLCKCDCGTIKKVNKPGLSNGRSQSCGCRNAELIKQRFITNNPRRNQSNGTCIIPYFFTKIKDGAKKRNIQFDLTVEYIAKLYSEQKGKCALSGVDLILPCNSYDKIKGLSTASLDRIDHKKGYVVGNVQWVHKVINKMRNSLSITEFKEWCNKVSTL